MTKKRVMQEVYFKTTQEKTPGNAPGVFLAWFISPD
jgi:hypothetical protein